MRAPKRQLGIAIQCTLVRDGDRVLLTEMCSIFVINIILNIFLPIT